MNVRVVHEGSWTHPGGAARVAKHLALALDAPVTVGHTARPEFWSGVDVNFPFQEGFHAGASGRAYRRPELRSIAELRLAQRFRGLEFDEDVIVTSGTAAKWFVPRYDQDHVHYCHVPPPRFYARPTTSVLDWAVTTAAAVVDRHFTDFCTGIVANSAFTRDRVEKHYGREEVPVLHPPVRTESFSYLPPNEDRYFVCIGRLTEMKRAAIVAEAFEEVEEARLVMVGDGPLRARCESIDGVTVYDDLSDFAVEQLVARSTGGIAFAREEHCGITPKEFQAAGKPVVVPDEPNLNNHVADDETGVVVAPTREGVRAGVGRVLDTSWDEDAIRIAARRWSVERFHREAPAVLEEVLGRKPPVVDLDERVPEDVLDEQTPEDADAGEAASDGVERGEPTGR